jgi:hypothetical protein
MQTIETGAHRRHVAHNVAQIRGARETYLGVGDIHGEVRREDEREEIWLEQGMHGVELERGE